MCLYPKKYPSQPMYLPCGKCIECKIKKSQEWSYRIALEASLYKENCFITLTYNEDNLPPFGSLVKKDLQDFIKRLRFYLSKKEKIKIRFFACGEYGKKYGRPHYHICVFGWRPKDLFFHSCDNKGTKIYRSVAIEKEWKKGFSSVIEWDNNLSIYCAKYIQKKVLPKDQINKIQPYVVMSNRPGIGANAVKDKWLNSDKIYINGHYTRLPRYFLDLLERKYPERVQALKDKRYFKSKFYDLGYASVFSGMSYEEYCKDLEIYFEDIEKRKEKNLKKFGFLLDNTKNILYNRRVNKLAPYDYDKQLTNVAEKWRCQVYLPILEPCDFDEDGVLIKSPFEE